MAEEAKGFNPYSVINPLLKQNFDSIIDMADHIKKDFKHLGKFNSDGLSGEWTAYINNEGTIGSLIVDDGYTRVCALADFVNEQQIIAEVDPDGFGNRFQFGRLTDVKLLALKQ